MKNLVSFFEIPCIDFKRAIAFYETLFGLKLEVLDCGYEKMAFFSDAENQTYGAISWAADFKPSKDGVLISFTCQDIDKSLDFITKNGGKIQIPKTKIEADGRGYFATFVDCEGNRLGLWSQE